jgi:signal transduction histidine kinase
MTQTENFPQEELALALARDRFGVATLDAERRVLRRVGALSEWLPAPGEDACLSPALLNMEAALLALQTRGGELALPLLRLSSAPDAGHVTVVAQWCAAERRYLVVTTPDRAEEELDRLLVADRRERLMLRQQAEATAQRLSVADALYREIVESSGNLVLRFRGDLKIVFANERAARFLGLPQGALPGENVARLFPGVDRGASWRADMCAAGPALFETPARDAGGALVWLDWEARWIETEGGGEFQASGRDATAARRLRIERDRAAEAAREAGVAAERLRIAHDLHDTLVRSIVTLIVQTRALAMKTADAATRTALETLAETARGGLDETRRALTQIRVARIQDVDLGAIIADFAPRLLAEQAMELRAAIDAESVAALAPEIAAAAAGVLREALRNVELHSGARRVDVALRRSGETLALEIIDDGVGFDPARAAPDHYGLVGMAERAAAIGGALTVASAPGAGACVTLTAPFGAVGEP